MIVDVAKKRFDLIVLRSGSLSMNFFESGPKVHWHQGQTHSILGVKGHCCLKVEVFNCIVVM